MSGPQAGYGPRHAGGRCADERCPFDHLAISIEVHVPIRRERRCLAIVEKGRLTVQVGQHKAAAANIAGNGIGNRERKADGDSRVDGIAAITQDLLGHQCAVPVRYGNGGLSFDNSGLCNGRW